VRYLHQRGQLTYNADRTVVGGEIVIDDDLLNEVNLPRAVESRLQALRIELPQGQLVRQVNNWSPQTQVEFQVAGLLLRGVYWSGALSPGEFPQPQNISSLFSTQELVEVVAREIAATSALNNAVAYEVALRPLYLLTGFRPIEWYSHAGLYVGGDLAVGWIKTTDLTFKQGRELLTDIDLAEEIRNVLPDALEPLINTEETADILLTAIESRIPLYGFGLPRNDGRTTELTAWVGYQWHNRRWAGDLRLGLLHQWQTLSNDHPSEPILRVRRWAPTINVKWVFNKERTSSALFSE